MLPAAWLHSRGNTGSPPDRFPSKPRATLGISEGMRVDGLIAGRAEAATVQRAAINVAVGMFMVVSFSAFVPI